MASTSPAHFLDLPDVGADELKAILKSAHEMKRVKFTPPQHFSGMSLAMIFDKKSTRTRISFEVAMKQLGGHTIVMNAEEIQLSGAESLEDTGKVLSRFVDAVMIRMSNHDILSELASHSTIPFINGLTDHSHPCQIMADLMTVEEKLGDLSGRKVAWYGDYNNVARTWGQAAKLFDFDMAFAVPEDQHADITDFTATCNAKLAAQDADILVTDTWVSMGQEGKGTEKFEPFKVTGDLFSAAKDHAIFMHCMPVHRGHEVSDDVLSSAKSVIYDEAENRLHAQKAILMWCLKDTNVKV